MEQERIGIGIVTYNRLDSLKRLVWGIEEHCELPYDLYISIDGSTDGTFEWVKEEEYKYGYRERMGVCYGKNDILKRFRDHAYSFILEDDVIIHGPGVFKMYIRATELFGIQHFNFLAPTQRIPSGRPNETKDGITVMFSKYLGGCFSTYTKEIIDKVGAFNYDFKGYGHGHVEHTRRIIRAGLTSPWGQFAHLVTAEPLLDHAIGTCVTPTEERLNQTRANALVFDANIRNPEIYIPFRD